MRRLIKALTFSIIIGLSACANSPKENIGIVKKVEYEKDGSTMVSIMDNDGNIETYTIDSNAVELLNEGDKIEFETKKDNVVAFEKNNYNQEVTLTQIYDSVSKLIGDKDSVSIFSAREFADNYGIEPDSYEDGVAILSNTSGDIRTVIIIEANDPIHFQPLFTELVDGLKATYQNQPELLEKLEHPYMRFEKGHAVLIVGDEQLRQDVLLEMEACEQWAN